MHAIFHLHLQATKKALHAIGREASGTEDRLPSGLINPLSTNLYKKQIGPEVALELVPRRAWHGIQRHFEIAIQ